MGIQLKPIKDKTRFYDIDWLHIHLFCKFIIKTLAVGSMCGLYDYRFNNKFVHILYEDGQKIENKHFFLLYNHKNHIFVA
jgi:hypothetical protein